MSILFPMFALFALTLTVMLRLAYMRFMAVRSGEVSPGYFRLFQGGLEPENLAAYSRNYINLHESPLLFHIICLVIFTAGVGNALLVSLAWVYVLLRVLHSWVHLSSNNVLHRFRIFALSSLMLALIWLVTLIRLLQAV